MGNGDHSTVGKLPQESKADSKLLLSTLHVSLPARLVSFVSDIISFPPPCLAVLLKPTVYGLTFSYACPSAFDR